MNIVLLIGRLTKENELRYLPNSETAVIENNLAVDRMNGKDEADFPRVKVFGKQAENMNRFTHKGSKVAIQGRIQTGSHKNKEGQTVYTTDVIADRIEFLEFQKKEEPEEYASIGEKLPF